MDTKSFDEKRYNFLTEELGKRHGNVISGDESEKSSTIWARRVWNTYTPTLNGKEQGTGYADRDGE